MLFLIYMNKKHGQPGHSTAVQQIIHDLKATFTTLAPGTPCPPAREIAEMYGVSRTTIKKCIKTLASEGVIECCNGKPPKVAGGTLKKRISQKNLSESVYEEFIEQIKAGRYRKGELLPKKAFLAENYLISEFKLSKIMIRLCEEGYVHKRGKRFIIGGKPSIKNRKDPWAILFIMPKITSWQSLFNDRTSQFAWELELEMQKNQIRPYYVVVKPENMTERALLWDEQEISNLIQQLGSAYRGTLIIGSRNEIENIDQKASFLSRFNQSVVWFDRYDESPISFQNKNIFRCHFSEISGVKAAFNHLIKMGHSKASFISFHEENWISTRGKLIQSYAEKYTITIHTVTPYSTQINKIIDSGNIQFIKDCLVKFSSTELFQKITLQELDNFNETTREKIYNDERLQYALLIEPVFKAQSTIIIAPNDWMGGKFYALVHRGGKKIPKDCSIISFDNRSGLLHRSLTSVDFGFASLAYMAIHLLLRDLPLSSSKQQNIPAIATVIDRNSVSYIE